MSYLKTKTTKKIILISLIIVFMWTSIEYGANNFTAYSPPIPDEFNIENNLATASINSLQNYTMTTGYAYNWIDVSGGTELLLTDDGYSTQSLPFDFRFYNETFSTIYLGANGYLSFNDSSPGDWSNDPIPSEDSDNYYLIAPFWDDLRPYSGGGSGNITVQSFGTYWVAEWRNIEEYWAGSLVGSFEVILHESGEIIFNYDYISYIDIDDGYTCGLNLGADVQYYNSYQGLNNLTDNFAILFTYPVFYDIVIDDLPGSLTSWSWAETQPWFGGGSGTPGAPYIIEDHTFEFSAGSGSCFSILNSRKYFIINNCTFNNSDSNGNGLFLSNTTNGQITNNQMINNYRGIFLYLCNDTSISDNLVYDNDYYGIFLENSHFNTVSENNASFNTNRGIRLRESTFNTISENSVYDNGLWDGIQLYFGSSNNTVSGNTISNSGDNGIELLTNALSNNITGNTIINHVGEGISIYLGCDNNLVYENILKNNVLHAVDNGANNDWNNSYIGNYWDNYIGYDMNLDGIGDFPYSIIGSAGNYDYLPIWNLQNQIAIDDLPTSLTNWSWAETQPWFGGGSGTELDPYILQDFNIESGGGTGNCLSIENSRKHFVVKECSLSNSGTSTTNAGIYLSNVTNALIIDNDCTNNLNGIYFESSHNNDFSSNTLINNGYIGIWAQYTNHNNTISNNFVKYGIWGIAIENGDNNIIQNNNVNNITTNHGILLYGSGTNCIIDNNEVNTCNVGIRVDSFSNTIITHNTITNSTGHGLDLNGADNSLVFENYFIINGNNAIDNGVNNDWNNTVIGNYWDDYTGYDMDLDGIGDDPYSITGSAGNFDYLPIWDLQGPIAIDDLPSSLNNWTWAASQAWCSGSGTELDPYIIENISIDASSSPTGSGIFINNSKNDYFIIRNCNVTNAGSGNYDAGIKLENTNHGTLINNNCSNNGRSGICLLYSEENTISGNTANDNTHFGIYLIHSNYTNITGNTANYNDDHGIWLSTDCNNNTISDNTANYNEDDGIRLDTKCDDNTISGNTASENTNYYGIELYLDCDNNTLSGNTVNKNSRGIHLDNCDNNTISDNTANYNTYFGIYLYQSHYTTITGNTANYNDDHGIYLENNCYNNTISGNTVKDNVEYGIYLYDNCDYNDIIDNIFYNNTQGIRIASGCDNNSIYKNFLLENGIHAIDDGTDNTWNSTSIGNYWDNHTGPDVSPNDGIVDNPYSYIGGSAGSIDYLPIAEDGPPSIVINSPLEDDVFGTSAPSFSVTITDTFLDEMWYTLDGGLHNYTFTGSTGTIDQSAWDAMPDGMITLTFYASDIPGNIGSAEVNIEKDSHAPLIVISSPLMDVTFGANAPSFIVEISDDNLDSMWYSLDGGITNFFFTANGTINQAAWSVLSEGSVTITFYANDTLGNLESESVDVVKSLPPPEDNFIVIIIIVISIVAGVAIVTVVLLLRRRKAGVEI